MACATAAGGPGRDGRSGVAGRQPYPAAHLHLPTTRASDEPGGEQSLAGLPPLRHRVPSAELRPFRGALPGGAGWSYHELAIGHGAMLTAPERFSNGLKSAGSREFTQP